MGKEGGLLVDVPGIRMHKVGCKLHGSQTAEAKKDVPKDAIGLDLNFAIATPCTTWCAPLWITVYDKDHPDKFYRWCINKRSWGDCNEASEVTVKQWQQRNFQFSCFEEHHGYKPESYMLGLGVYFGHDTGEVTTLIKTIAFEVTPQIGGAVDNVVMWGIDNDLENKKRMLQSIEYFVKARASGNCNFPRVPLAYAIIAAGDDELSCEGLQELGLKVPCKEVVAVPHDVARGCAAAKRPKETLLEGHVAIIKLLPKLWNRVFAKTVDAFSLAINKGQPKDAKMSRRVELIYNRANHIRFISDYIFLPLGIRQVLYLDNDICPLAAPDELFRTPGRAAVVVARKVDGGRPVTRYVKENIRIGSDFSARAGMEHGFVYSFNAGVVLLRTETMCAKALMSRLLQVQNYHNSVQRLWDKGTNQPPFEIAAANSQTMVPWYWNCRLLEGDIRDLEASGVSSKSPVRWMGDCKFFHPTTHGKTIKERSCKMFDKLETGTRHRIEGKDALSKCGFSIYMYNLPWPWDDLKPVANSKKWPMMAASDTKRKDLEEKKILNTTLRLSNSWEDGLSKDFAFGPANTDVGEMGITKTASSSSLGSLIYYRLKHSLCMTENPDEADVFVIPMFMANKDHQEWSTKCAEIISRGGTQDLLKHLKHLTDENANRHVLFNVKNLKACERWWAAPFADPLIAQVQRASVRYCYSPPCDSLAVPDPIKSIGAMYSVPYPSYVHWSTTFPGEPPWGRARNRPILMSLIMESRMDAATNWFKSAKMLRQVLWDACGVYGEPLCKRQAPKSMQHVAQEAFDIYTQSVFCLQPQGDTCERKGILDSILVGCIPVLFYDEVCPQRQLWELHWGSWQKDSAILFDVNDVLSGSVDVRAELAKVSRSRRLHMQNVIRRYGHRLQYNFDDPAEDKPDALALLFRAIKYGRSPPTPPFYTTTTHTTTRNAAVKGVPAGSAARQSSQRRRAAAAAEDEEDADR